MKIRIELDPQVVAFVRSLAPEPRKLVRSALKGLEQEKGDIKQLEGELSGYTRLRVASYRLIIRFYAQNGQRIARCVFAEKRAIVYELFADILRGQISKT
jgi:mRNA-degrading endonuclease RelE of RelBE toxin-antitoxin system